jgi:hypothetical protein
MASSLDDFPDELLVRILSFVPAIDLSDSVSLTSTRMRRVAMDEAIWETACASLLEQYSDDPTARFDREIWCPVSNGITMAEFWRNFLRYYASRLGWWTTPPFDSVQREQILKRRARAKVYGNAKFEVGQVYCMLASLSTGMLYFSRVHVTNGIWSLRYDPNRPGLLGLPPGVVLREPPSYQIRAQSQSADNEEAMIYTIHLFDPQYELRPLDMIQFSSGLRRPVTFTDGHPGAGGGSGDEMYEFLPVLHHKFTLSNDSPVLQMLPAFDVDINRRTGACTVPTISNGMGAALWRLYDPRTFDHFDTDTLVRSGWYAGEHPIEGIIIVLVRTVYPGQGGSGALLADRERIIGVQMTGHDKGQIVFDAAIDRTSNGIISTRSQRPLGVPWPVDDISLKLGESMSALHGWDDMDDLNGAVVEGRTLIGVTERTKKQSKEWIGVLVHVASQVELQLCLVDEGVVTTFKKLELH